jgi:hypothetical protein
MALKYTLKYTSYEAYHSFGIRGRRYILNFLMGNMDLA